jgi:exodeoxyribonuclease VII large subunit
LTDIARALPRRERLLESPRQRFDNVSVKLGSALTLLVHRQRARLDRAAAQLTPAPLLQVVRKDREKVTSLAHRIQLSVQRQMDARATRLTAGAGKLDILSYRATLNRGFALVAKAGRGLVDRGADIKAGDKLEITFADGAVPATATGSVAGGAAPPASRKKAKTAGQGDLF